MKFSCKAIVLKRINYSETSVIISCFTKEFGVKSFLYKGGKKKNNAVLMPLKIVDIQYYQHNADSLANVTTIQTDVVLNNLYLNPIKTSLLFFMNEFLGQLLVKIQFTEPHLFEEIEQELIWLDASDELTNYPLFWLIQWTEKLGIKPTISVGSYFDIETARFLEHAPNSTMYHHGDEVAKLATLFSCQRLEILSYVLTKNERTKLLNVLLDYYRIHLPEFRELKSIEILQTVYN